MAELINEYYGRLRNLTLRIPTAVLPFSHLESMLARSKCVLTTLLLAGMMTNDEELLHLLVTVPSLDRLFLKFYVPTPFPWPVTRLSDNFFRHFTTDASESEDPLQPFLPLLQTFFYLGPQSLSWSTLATIYEVCAGLAPVLDSRSEQPQLSERPLLDLGFIMPDPETTDDYIDKASLHRLFRLPECDLEFAMDVNLLKASIAHHGITPGQAAVEYYNLKQD